MRLMGEKDKARQAMKKAKVPILPGSEGVLQNEEEAVAWARSVGFPVILKASAGGGGRGMRVVRSEEELPQLYQAAHTEASNAFGNGDLYMEKFIERPRHIEFQILADEHGNVLSLGERECSIQRRHQKLIEEAPSLQVTPKIREDIAKTLKRCLTAIGYQNAGTVEFLMDEDGKLYFIEMNTRIQVEHPVTEMVTGIDLVKAQLRIAAGETLASILPEAVPIRGHAIECRVNAEHPEKFTPSAGRITAFNVPGGNGVRVDTAQYAEGIVPPYYDSLIAKLIVHGKDRAEAMARMSRALEMFVVEGIHTTIPLHRRILDDPEFREGNFDTKFMERFFEREKLRREHCQCKLPRLYPILDAGLLLRAGLSIEGFARELREAGVRFLQYRDKDASDEVVLERAALLRRIFPPSDSCLILNDRVSLVRAAGYDGIHVGQEDLSPAEVRATLGPECSDWRINARREPAAQRGGGSGGLRCHRARLRDFVQAGSRPRGRSGGGPSGPRYDNQGLGRHRRDQPVELRRCDRSRRRFGRRHL